MHRFLGAVAFVLAGWMAAASVAVEAAPPTTTATATAEPQRTTPAGRGKDWVETGRDDGVVSFKREVAGSDVIALRGEGAVAAPLMRVVSVLLDYARAPEWIDSLAEVRVIRMTGPLEFIEYDHVATPPLVMQDRDFVCHGKLWLDLHKQTFAMMIEPAKDPAVPLNDDYVRGELRGFWWLQATDGGKKTFVITEMHGDPKGGVPKWLVNLFQNNWARSTLQSLRSQVAKKDIQLMPQVKAAFAGLPVDLTDPRTARSERARE